MNFHWVPSLRRYYRTQEEAKATKLPFEKVDVPIDQRSLMEKFNAYQARIDELEAQLKHDPPPVLPDDVEGVLDPTPIYPARMTPEPPLRVEVTHATREEIDSWFEPAPEDAFKPIDRILAKASYGEAMLIQGKATERMVHCLHEMRS